MPMKRILQKFSKDPLGLLTRVLYKTTIGRLRYSRGDDYDAARYWQHRFAKYGSSLQGAGDEGLSETENEQMYAAAAATLVELCRQQGVSWPEASVLEIGCGTGYYTQVLHGLGVQQYQGIDITDVLFSRLKSRFPGFQFVRKDITADRMEGQFEIILMIDVIEHIVTREKFSRAMENVRNCLAKGGLFILAPISSATRKHLFYVHTWSLETIKAEFEGYNFEELIPFRDDTILVVRKPG